MTDVVGERFTDVRRVLFGLDLYPAGSMWWEKIEAPPPD
jgi:hypothetical protein